MITLAALRLTAVEPFAITAPEVAEASDLPVVCDPRTGHLVLPGTTVAGSLRAHTARTFDLSHAAKWFGPEVGPNGSIDASSRVRIVGALLHDNNGSPVAATIANLQVQTAIDRKRKAASLHSRRDSLVVPAGVQLSVFIRIDDLDVAGVDGNEILDLFASWAPTLGRAKTSGHGKMRLDTCTFGTIDLSVPAQRWQWITLHGSALFDAVCTKSRVISKSATTPVVSQRFRIVDPLRIGGGLSDVAPANLRKLPTRRTMGGRELAPYDGSSLKGVLRSRCEFIVNSIRLARGLGPDNSIVDEIFGSVSSRGIVRFLDAPVLDALVGQRHHVAIDRVSGGARKSALYVDEVFEDGKLTLSLETIDGASIPPHAVELLGVAFNDICDGFVGIGSSTGRGYGTISPIGERMPVKLSADTITRICQADSILVAGDSGDSILVEATL
jgi:CRISPR/Cas system CSM-associated protein Csm3 (group 7 of RAMP superfamily)